MLPPALINSRFKLFQRKSKWFSGLNYNSYLLTNVFFCKSITNFYLATNHIDLISWYLKWKLKKSGSLVFPSHNTYPITKKPTEVRMGKGKGPIVDWTIPVKNGAIPFYFYGKKTPLIKKLFQDILKKLPFQAKVEESKHILPETTKLQVFFSVSKLTWNWSLIRKSFF